MGRSDSLPPLSPHFVAFVWRYRRFVPSSSPPARDQSWGSSWSWSAGSPTGSHDGGGRVSQVPERPSCPCALFWDPGRTETRQAVAACRRGPRLSQQRRLPRAEDFGARSHGIGTRCLRFAGRVTPPPRKTRFRLLAKLCRAGFVHPQGCNERFPSSSLFLLSRACLTL